MSGPAHTFGARVRHLTGADTRHKPLPPRRPQVRIELARTMPVWLVRIVAAVLLLGAGVLVATGPVQLVLAAGVAVGIALTRTGMVSSFGIALVFLAFLARQMPQGWLTVPPGLQTAGLLVCLHGCAYLTRRSSELSASGRVELSALAAGAVPALAINAFAQVLNLLLIRVESAPATVVGVVALAALTAVCWLTARSIRASDQDGVTDV